MGNGWHAAHWVRCASALGGHRTTYPFCTQNTTCTSRMDGKMRFAIACLQNKVRNIFRPHIVIQCLRRDKVNCQRQTPFMAIKLRKNAGKFKQSVLMCPSFQLSSNFEMRPPRQRCAVRNVLFQLLYDPALFIQTVQSFLVIKLDSAIISASSEHHWNRFFFAQTSCIVCTILEIQRLLAYLESE